MVDTAGAEVSGATVTAEAVSGLYGAADKSLFDRIFGVKTVYAAATFTVTAITDANGIARFNNLPPGNYKFTVSNNGKQMKSLAVTVPEGSLSNATVVLPASGGNIVAMISDADSKTAINNATVQLKNGSEVIDTKTTDSDGTVVFSGLAAGSYTVTASASNYDEKSINTTVTDKETVAAEIALTPKGGGMIITVKDDANAPLQDAKVSMTVNGQEKTANTDENGVATFTNLPAGSYTFTVTKAEYNSYTASATVTSGSIVNTDVTLTRRTGGATITVTDGTAVLQDAKVSVKVNGKAKTVNTLENGEATFTDMPTGTYIFTAAKAGYTIGTVEVTITNESTATAEISLVRQTGGATITVTDGTAALQDATVSVEVNGNTKTVNTLENGEATFTDMPTGTYTFTAAKAGYTIGTVEVTITNESTATAEISLTRQTGNATITVIGKDNQPIDGATVTVTLAGETVAIATTSAGKAFFTNLSAGYNHKFTVTKAGYNESSLSTTVNAGENAFPLTLYPEDGKVTITVIDTDSKPISEATVSTYVKGVLTTKTTDASGNADFTDLPSTSYSFTAEKNGYISGTANNIGVLSGYHNKATIKLSPKLITVNVNAKDGADNNVYGVSVRVTGNGVDQTNNTDVSEM